MKILIKREDMKRMVEGLGLTYALPVAEHQRENGV